jgi:hypothetical protein
VDLIFASVASFFKDFALASRNSTAVLSSEKKSITPFAVSCF